MVGTSIAGRFRVEERVAAGGMGIVYRATDRLTAATVAVKLMRAHEGFDPRRMEREATALRNLSNPAIVQYVSHGQTATGEVYLVMQWVDGESLEDRLQRVRHGAPGLTVPEAVGIVATAAEAVATAHRVGIVHRDLKPSNLMLEGGDPARVKVLDFGIALLADQPRLTLTGMTIGTPGYMSPEQVRGVRPIDGRTDVFALGCILYECLTSAPPFAGAHPLAVQAKVLLSDPPDVRSVVPQIPAELAQLTHRMLAKDAGIRPPDAGEVARKMRACGPLPGVTAPSAARLTAAAPTLPALPRSGAPSCVIAINLDVAQPPEQVGEQAAAVARIVASLGGGVEQLGYAMFVAHLDDHGTELSRRGALCARRLAEEIPGASVALVCKTDSGGDPLDRAVLLLSDATAEFSRTIAERCPAGALPVCVDDDTADQASLDTIAARGQRYITSVRTDAATNVRRDDR